MQLDINSLPWLPLDRRNFFPNRPAVYLAIAATSNILYIGRSDEVNSRWRSHEKLRYLKLLSSVRIAFVFAESGELHNLEASLIEEYKPYYNLRTEKLQFASEADKANFLRERLQFGFDLWDLGFLQVVNHLLKLLHEIKTCTKKLAKRFFSAPAEEQEELVWWFSGLSELSMMGDNLMDSLKSRAEVRLLFREKIDKSEAKYYLETCGKRCPQEFAQAVADLVFEWKKFKQSHGSLLLGE